MTLDGETSCITLPSVIRHKAETDLQAAQQIARLLPALGGQRERGHEQADANKVAQHLEELVAELGLVQPSLLQLGVGREQVSIIATKAAGGSPSEDIVSLVEGLF